MGCCCCIPRRTGETIVNDLTVTASATVGDVYFDHYTYQSYNLGGLSKGLMYVKYERLHYECLCGGALCCCQCSSCCGASYELKDITCIQVIGEQVIPVRVQNQRNSQHHGQFIRLNPGLKVVVKPPAKTHEVLILVQMKDASEFAEQLRGECSRHGNKNCNDQKF